MPDSAIEAYEAVDHGSSLLARSWSFAMDAEIARLQLLNRSEVRLAHAIRRMVEPSISPARRERRARALRQAEERRAQCAAPANGLVLRGGRPGKAGRTGGHTGFGGPGRTRP